MQVRNRKNAEAAAVCIKLCTFCFQKVLNHKVLGLSIVHRSFPGMLLLLLITSGDLMEPKMVLKGICNFQPHLSEINGFRLVF